MKQKTLFTGVVLVFCIIVGLAFPAFAQYTLSLEAKDAGGKVKTKFAKGEDLCLHINPMQAYGRNQIEVEKEVAFIHSCGSYHTATKGGTPRNTSLINIHKKSPER